MEQNAGAGVPVVPMVENKQKSGNGLKIATVIACVVAVCGIGFGVYGVMRVSEKDNQISDLKTQIEEFKTAESTKNNETVSTDTTVIEGDDDNSFTSNVLSSIKNLNGFTYGFKSNNFGNGYVYAYINSDGSLILENNEKHTIASNVVFVDFLWEGNGGAPSLYFVREDGSVGVVKNAAAHYTESPVVEEISINRKAVSVKNVTMQGGHKVVIVDIDGNFIDL